MGRHQAGPADGVPRDAAGWKAALWAEVDRRRDHFVDILAETIRRPSDNPPGDTTQVAEYLRSVLAGAGLSVEVLAPQPHMPNLVSRYVGAAEGRHLILNGHLDQFPVEDPSAWSVAPYGGEVRDGRVYGRGASDMKGGTVALAAAMILLAELRVPLKGRVTGTFVSDEETGGRWGTAWLLDHVPDLMGDAVLNAEPSSLDAVYLAEKGICMFKVTTRSRGGFAGRSTLDNAIYKMCRAVNAALKLRGRRIEPDPEIAPVVAASRSADENIPGLEGTSWVFDSITLNVGTIRGGAKVNVVPQVCEAEFDFRIPSGFTVEELLAEFRRLLAEEGLADGDVEIEPIQVGSPNHTSPDSEIARVLAANIAQVTGRTPGFRIGAGGSDCRYWRQRGIPAVIAGPRQHNLAGVDEYILVDDFLATIKTHLGAIVDYLGVA